jgi:hypothetical protein
LARGPASPGDAAAVDRFRQIADRKLPEIGALIRRSELVRDWLECAVHCECPNIDDPRFSMTSPAAR